MKHGRFARFQFPSLFLAIIGLAGFASLPTLADDRPIDRSPPSLESPTEYPTGENADLVLETAREAEADY